MLTCRSPRRLLRIATLPIAYFRIALLCDSRYLANIENEGTLPSLPVVIQLIKICGLPVERYFNPELMREESAERQRVSHKLQLCPEEYLPIVEGAIDGALRIHEQEKEPVCV